MKHELTSNSDKYAPDVWSGIDYQKQKEKILKDTAECIQENFKNSAIETTFKGQRIQIGPINNAAINAKVKINNKMTSGQCGQFDPIKNQIQINPIILRDGKMSCEALSHEATHKTQSEVAKIAEEYSRHSIEWEYATIAKMSESFDNEFGAFNIRVNGRFYISGSRLGTPVLNRTASALYALSAMERHACLTAMSITKNIPEFDLQKLRLDHLSYSESYLANAILSFRQTYYCDYMPIQQIYKSVDNAQAFISFGRGHINDLEANIAYDMIAIMEFENSELTREEALAKLYERMCYENKREALSLTQHVIIDQPHELIGGHVVLNDQPISQLQTLAQLKSMHASEQISNPLMIANFAFEKEINVFPYLHCPEAFEEWLYSESSLKQLPPEIQAGLGEVLGERFSLENRRQEFTNRKEQSNNKKVEEDVGYIFEDRDR
jgi:hypothetical protein